MRHLVFLLALALCTAPLAACGGGGGGGDDNQEAPEQLDQEFDPASPGAISGVSRAVPKAQTFTVGVTGLMTRIELTLSEGTSGTGPWTVDIRPAPGGVPEETNVNSLGSVSFPDESNLTGNFEWISMPFDSPIAVNQGDELAIVIIPDDGNGSFTWRGDNTEDYPAGDGFFRNPSAGINTWSSIGFDHMFRTYVSPSAP